MLATSCASNFSTSSKLISSPLIKKMYSNIFTMYLNSCPYHPTSHSYWNKLTQNSCRWNTDPTQWGSHGTRSSSWMPHISATGNHCQMCSGSLRHGDSFSLLFLARIYHKAQCIMPSSEGNQTSLGMAGCPFRCKKCNVSRLTSHLIQVPIPIAAYLN